jgi:hypothetical protein
MTILRIQHRIRNFEVWKKAFDADPIEREKKGVRRYRVCRPADDPNMVIVDLEFDNSNNAASALAALEKLWTKVEGTVMFDPQTQILEIVEGREY